MTIGKHEQFLLFDFLRFLSARMDIKIDYLKLIREYEEEVKGKYQ